MSSLKWLSGWDPQLLPRLDQLDVITSVPERPELGTAAPAPVMTAAGLPKRTPFATLSEDDLDAPVPYVPVEMTEYDLTPEQERKLLGATFFGDESWGSK